MFFNPNDCKIRLMTDSDVDTVTSINWFSFPRPWKREEVAVYPRSKNKFGLIAELSSSKRDIIGFALCDINFDRACVSQDCLYLSLLATAGWARKHGVAERLVRAVQVEMQRVGKTRLELHVHSLDEAPIRLYEKTGFRHLEEVPNFYDNVSAYRMAYDR